MTPPTKIHNYHSDDVYFDDYRVIDALKYKFIIADSDEEDVNSFVYANNDLNNVFMKLLVYIADKINEINQSIVLSLKVIQEEYYYDEFLKISAKITDFEDTYKIEELDDTLDEMFSFEFLDKIIISMEF